jgi:3-demethoxyubiquinol 3-hydroxylase
MRCDVAVIGGGVIGLATALAAARQGLQTVLVEAHAPKAWQAESPDLRVYALALDSQALFESMGLWQQMMQRRAFAYSGMTVFDEVHDSPLRFRADALGRPHLGHIVENGLLVETLWQAVLNESGVRLICPDKIAAIDDADDGAWLRLQSGQEISARLVIGADGAGSKVRSLAGIESDQHDYRQKGLVAFVETGLPHRNTAWQRFLSSGPLAFLPFGEKRCSIVWSLPETKADDLLSAEPEAFCLALDSAFAGTLGTTRLLSARAAFPLKRRLARTMLKGRTLLLGDAAHAVHPLAGQGVNLGLRDVAALGRTFETARMKTGDALDPGQLQRWARGRYSDNAVAAMAFENINRVFSNDHAALSLTRGHLLGLADRLGPLKHAMARYAAGV